MNKYRAWDKEKKLMITELFVDSDGYIYELANVNYDTPNIEIEGLRNAILMQSTGLKDKNGVDVYEKDIGWDEYSEAYGQIIWRDGAYYFKWENISDLLSEVCGDIEVCGNIHAKPELLNQKN